MAIPANWESYAAWNQAFGSVLFTSANSGRPVYLDMDDDVLAQVAAKADVDPRDAAEQLTLAVRSTLSLASATGPVFEQHLRNLRRWRRETLRDARDDGRVPQAPPVLALLAVLTLAAEEMQHDQDHAGSAYYPRLFHVLHVDGERQRSRLINAYRNDAEELWGGLNEWLSAADGQLGLPTAYALSHRYVGLPLSQALVRSADRSEFPLMFQRYGLPPGGDVSPADMERLFESWLQMRPCPVSRSLESLWERGQARERIASVAAIELRSWDGTLPDTDQPGGRKVGGVQLACWMRRFPRRRLDITFLASFGTHASPEVLRVLTAHGEPEVEVVPVPGARLQPIFTSEIDTASLVEGVLRLAETTAGLETSRYPRRVATFRYDDLLNAYVECERVPLGEDSLLLVKDDKGLPGSVRAVLTQIARPGFSEETEFPGLPDGWVLFVGVQILTAPERELPADLNALIPLLSAQLAFAEGTKLPGKLRKWSSLDPPEIRAVVQGASQLSVRLTSLQNSSDTREATRTWTSDGPALVASLTELCLPDGDYEVSVDNAGKCVQQAVLRLRSSDTPDVAALHAVTHLMHDTGRDCLAVLGARPPLPGALERDEVRGAYSPLRKAIPAPTTTITRKVWWNGPRPAPSPRQPPITLTAIDPDSCVVTGAHYIELPLADGTAKGGLISGTCKHCGLIKRYPAHIRWSRATRGIDALQGKPLQVNTSELPKVAEADHSTWDVALDGLIHTSGGTYHSLEYLASQIEASPLFTDTFTRSLEVRGDLEVGRNADFTPARWEMSPAYLAGMAVGGFLLIGSWSRDDREALQDLAAKAGGTFTCQRDRVGLARYVVTGIAAAELAEICKQIGTAGVVPDAGARLLRALPPLSKLEASLPRIPLPSTGKIQQFHLPSSSWAPAASAAEPGAYRFDRGLTRIDVFRAPADVEAGTAALGTVQLIKHLAALRTGHAMLAYHPDRHFLAVPLGADLPGLYGRAAVLCGGRLPVPDAKQRVLAYLGVPQHVANAMNSLLTS